MKTKTKPAENLNVGDIVVLPANQFQKQRRLKITTIEIGPLTVNGFADRLHSDKGNKNTAIQWGRFVPLEIEIFD